MGDEIVFQIWHQGERAHRLTSIGEPPITSYLPTSVIDRVAEGRQLDVNLFGPFSLLVIAIFLNFVHGTQQFH